MKGCYSVLGVVRPCLALPGYISSPVSFTLEVIINPRFFHDLICHVPGLYFPINRYLDINGGFEPYIMITPAVMVKNKSMLLQDFSDFFFILCHY
ncbi:MAG: hypothetical protein LBB68_01945 [Treponema sp.]|nr:hypothetical protein [Treponema sp.]